jgi:hypothetical protein
VVAHRARRNPEAPYRGTAQGTDAEHPRNEERGNDSAPLNKQLTNVVLDATDGAGQRVAGTFTLHHGGGTVTRSAGQPIASIKIKPLVHRELDENGKPHPVTNARSSTSPPTAPPSRRQTLRSSFDC